MLLLLIDFMINQIGALFLRKHHDKRLARRSFYAWNLHEMVQLWRVVEELEVLL